MEEGSSSPLLGEEEPRAEPRFKRAHFVALGFLAVTATALTKVTVTEKAPSAALAKTGKTSVIERAPSSSLSASGFSILVEDPDYPKPSSVAKGIYPFDAVYAPNRVHNLKFVGASLKGSGVTWTVSKKSTSDEGDVSYETVSSWKGGVSESSVQLSSEAGREHMITAVDDSGNSANHTFSSKHIRREIRSLSDADRELFLAALAKLMETPTEAGRELYGDDFFGGEWFTRWHMTSRTASPGGKIKSPWHGQPSFLTAHVAFTDVFERSLQSVNPKAAAHFYDYTIDGENLDDWTTSEVWTDKFFGMGTADTKYAVGGIWADVKHSVVTDVDEGTGRLHNSYGIETMPYNNNPSMAISRATSWCGLKTDNYKLPTCTELTTVLTQPEKNNVIEFFQIMNRLMHGELHNLMGGMWSCAVDVQDVIDKNPNLTSSMTDYLKEFDNVVATNYYDEKVTCPDSCDIAETDFTDCTCSCPDYDLTEDVSSDVWGKRFAEVVGSKATAEWTPKLYSSLVQADDGTYSYEGLSPEDNSVAWEMQVKLVCSPPKLADFATPYASPFDPIFFPVHVSNERYWTYTRLVRDDAEFVEFDKGWSVASLDGDDAFIGCDFHDPMEPFDNAYGNVREPTGTYYTNQEIMALYSPYKEELPYIFEDLSWSHCGNDL